MPAAHHQKWLVVKLADIGDLLTITPALARLRAARPDDTLHVLATPHSAPVLAGTGLADSVLSFDKFAFDRAADLLRPGNWRAMLALGWRLRRTGYDHVLILHHLTTRFGALKYAGLALASGAPQRTGLDNGRGWFLNRRVDDGGFGAAHEAACWLRVVDKALDQPAAAYNPATHPLHTGSSEADRAWAAATLPDQANGPRIAIHPGSGGYSTARRWSPQAFAAVADALHKRYNAQIVLVGGPRDDIAAVLSAMQHQPRNLAGQTTLGQLGALLAACDLFIGADSGVLHLASAANTPVVAIFGPSNAAAWGPWLPPERAITLRSNPVCSPCSYVLRAVGQRDGCPARTCMKMITPQAVIEAAEALLSGNPKPSPATPPPRSAAPLRVLGIPLDPLSWDDLRLTLTEYVTEDRPRQICTANPELVMIAQRDVNFYNILNRADLCVADGVGLLWAARRLGHPLPDRITGSDGLPRIAGWAAEAGWRLFLLGAGAGVAARAADILRERHPGLEIVGTFSGSPAADDEDAIVTRINAARPDILFVSYGSPTQEAWIARNLPRLEVKVAIGVGAALDFLTGVQPRAPQAWRRLGLEWLYRLLHDPRRIGRMTRLPRFVLTVLRRGPRGPAQFVGPHDR